MDNRHLQHPLQRLGMPMTRPSFFARCENWLDERGKRRLDWRDGPWIHLFLARWPRPF